MTEQDKVTVDYIIGIVKTEEQTNSVEEVRKLRGRETMTEKRFKYHMGLICEKKDGEYNLLTIKEVTDLLNSLNNENEQLKSTIKDVVELLSEEVDLFSDKATEHDINAYVELKELDNKDAYYMATSTKKAIQMLKEFLE